LVEKQKTTPDVYPMTLNGLVTGCNQKSNRDPILTLTDVAIEESLARLQKLGLVMRVDSGRVEKWRHTLYDEWRVSKPEIAVLAELLLRGPQTEGELRGRVSRMEPVDDLDALRGILKPLAERKLVVYLSPEGRRGTTVTHGFHSPEEYERLRSHHADAAAADESPEPIRRPTPAAAPDAVAGLEARLGAANDEIGRLRQQVTELQAGLARLMGEVRALQTGLGVPSPGPG
jgi:uncharacterized protein YceH (UPF0502 family)